MMARGLGGGVIIGQWGWMCWGWFFVLFFCWWSIPLSFPAGTDLLFFVLPKKSKQKKGAPEMATSPWICVAGREGAKLAALRQGSFLFPPRNKNPRRHLGQERQRPKRWFACSGGVSVVAVCCFASLAISTWSYCFASRLAAHLLLRLSFDGVAVPCPRWRLEFS